MEITDFFVIIGDFLNVIFLATETTLEFLESITIFEINLLGWLYIFILTVFIFNLIAIYFPDQDIKIGLTDDEEGDLPDELA